MFEGVVGFGWEVEGRVEEVGLEVCNLGGVRGDGFGVVEIVDVGYGWVG